MKTHNVRNMILIGLILIAMLCTMAATCEESGSLEDFGNDTADAIDQWAEDAGIPNCVSCEIYDNLTD